MGRDVCQGIHEVPTNINLTGRERGGRFTRGPALARVFDFFRGFEGSGDPFLESPSSSNPKLGLCKGKSGGRVKKKCTCTQYWAVLRYAR